MNRMQPNKALEWLQYFPYEKKFLHIKLIQILNDKDIDLNGIITNNHSSFNYYQYRKYSQFLKILSSYKDGQLSLAKWLHTTSKKEGNSKIFSTIFPYLKNSKKGQEALNNWVTKWIINNPNEKRYINVINLLPNVASIEPSIIMKNYWAKYNKSNSLGKAISEHLSKKGLGIKVYCDTRFMRWVFTEAEKGTITSNHALLFATNFLTYPDSNLESLALSYLKANIEKIENSNIYSFLDRLSDKKYVEMFFTLFKKNDQKKAAIAFSKIVSDDILFAERIAKDSILGNDSYLKKSIIVDLINKGSSFGKKYVDQAFSGPFEREKYFHNIREIIYISQAVEQYIKISKHDYLETGKTWPPSYVSGDVSDSEKFDLKSFIKKYPWFPGVDDAYYRLAYSHFRDLEYNELEKLFYQYIIHKNIDNDAAPYIGFAIRMAIRKAEKNELNKGGFFEKIKEFDDALINSINGKKVSQRKVDRFMEWLSDNDKGRNAFNLTEKNVTLVNELLNLIIMVANKEETPKKLFNLLTNDEYIKPLKFILGLHWTPQKANYVSKLDRCLYPKNIQEYMLIKVMEVLKDYNQQNRTAILPFIITFFININNYTLSADIKVELQKLVEINKKYLVTIQRKKQKGVKKDLTGVF